MRNMWYVAAWSTELGTGAPIGRMIIGEPVVLWRQPNGVVVAMEDRCPHRHTPLSAGRIEGDRIRCMYHGLTFDTAGRCRSIPGSTIIPPNSNAKTFPAAEKYGWIWVWLGKVELADPLAIPQAWGLDNPDWVMQEGAMDYAADYQLLNDNLTDLSHLDFVHETTLGASVGVPFSNDQPKVTALENGLLIERWVLDHPFSPGQALRCDTFSSYRYLLPGLFLLSNRFYPAGTAKQCDFGTPEIEPIFDRADQQAVTPIGPGQTRYLYATGLGARYASAPMLEAMMGVVNAAFEEDRRMIEAQQRIWNATPPARSRAFIPQDKAPSMFRRLIARRLAAEAEPEDAAASGACENPSG